MRVLLLLTGHTKVIHARIDVKTNKGHVRLSGTVDNFYKKWSAIDNALKVSEVAEVIDQIKVKPTDTVDDRVLQKNIKKTLSNDSRLEQLEIKCEVLNGTVSLHGEVHSYYQRLAAEESCRWVKGVVNVENKIEVVPRNREFDQKIKKKD